MILLRSAIRLTQGAFGAVTLESSVARRFDVRLRALGGPRSSVRLGRRFRRSNGGYLLRASVVNGDCDRDFWIKWCPDADPVVLERSAERMAWWRRRNPYLADRVADIVQYWPEEHALLLEHRSGITLGRAAARSAADGSLKQVAGSVGGWLSTFSEVGALDQIGIEDRCGDEVGRNTSGYLAVNARRLLERRLALSERVVRSLHDAGFPSARHWADRHDLSSVLQAVSPSEPAGFVHGDFKPDNILVHGTDFAVIDWWDAPRISWPLPEVATVGANLWMAGGEGASRAWRAFLESYFQQGFSERTYRTVRLLGAMACLSTAAQMIQGAGIKARVDRVRCANVIRRLVQGGGIPDGD